jgi:hypothetical protein
MKAENPPTTTGRNIESGAVVAVRCRTRYLTVLNLEIAVRNKQ